MRAIPLVLNPRSGSAGEDMAERLAGLYRAAGVELKAHVAKSGDDIVRRAQGAKQFTNHGVFGFFGLAFESRPPPVLA